MTKRKGSKTLRQKAPEVAWDFADVITRDSPRISSSAELSSYLETAEHEAKQARTSWQVFWTDAQAQGMPENVGELAHFNFETGYIIGHYMALVQLRGLIDEQERRLQAIERQNAGRLVSGYERNHVIALNESLTRQFPKPGVRYRVIAERMSTTGSAMKASRVRYIIEGPRKTKSGNRGKRKRGSTN